LGVVLVIPPPVGAEVDGLRRALGDQALGRVPPHLTLVPPVNVAEDALPAALTLLRSVASRAGPLRLDLGPVATFWPETPVLYLAVSGSGVDQVGALWEAASAPPLQRSATRAFVPHVTVCDGADPARIPGLVAGLGAYRATVAIEALHLLEERPDRSWTPIAEIPLGGPAVVGRGGLPLELVAGAPLDPEAAAWSAAAWEAHNRACQGPGWRPDQPVAVTARREDRVVGVAEGAIVGAARGDDVPEPAPPSPEVGAVVQVAGLIVDPAARGQGIGSQLLRAVADLGIERGCGRLRVVVAAGGAGEAFCRHRGLTVTARLPGWRGTQDVLVMERRLGTG
jgi:GNAT superfamily N-acetyltransferase/2'-5' RNA ligase